MKEDFLHYVWKLKKFRVLNLTTSKGDSIVISSTGLHNQDSGPDFLNATIRIAGQLWAGNVEIHVKASDWYRHGHEKDRHYNNVILHVVWEDDIEVFRKDNSVVPTLVLKNIVSGTTLKNYQKLLRKNTAFINCEKGIASVNAVVLQNWLERLYFERLEEKSKFIFRELERSGNDWEAVLFRLLMKNFGLKVNGDAFYSIAKTIDYKIIRKIRHDPIQLESLFFGLAGFLDDPPIGTATYKRNLKEDYHYLQHKFRFSDAGIIRPKFSKLRPANFPTIRLSQMAMLYNRHQNLFSKIIATTHIEACAALFDVAASEYWNSHYTFGKTTSKSIKKLSSVFIELIIINTILPLKFCYSIYTGRDINDELCDMISSLKPEDNMFIKKYRALGINVRSAMESQALLQLYNTYCIKHQCLRCAVGHCLISKG